MYKRHDMLYISKAGRKKLLNSVSGLMQKNDGAIEELILDERIPAIVSRQDSPKEGYLQVGFAHYKKREGSRIKTGALLEKREIEKVITPFEAFSNGVIQKDFKMAEILNYLAEISEQCHISTGLYGSAALEVLTAYPYTDEKSDVDIFIKKRDNTSHILEFYDKLIQGEKYFGISVDCEAEVMGDYGVKLKELFSSQKTVLAKGFCEAKLFYKEELSDFLIEINEYKGRVQ